ncbi:hypothetical protein B0H63DRAFT_467812 [Podospora didyma]|uniref:Uncharacterized protein n=1 Tax=Podospora didyma TaxID=330526 RepID=A0AAE0NRS8_9PEZI|nr:hypothetical protein B0H63DRAFT_467812 [Podospora didyma]
MIPLSFEHFRPAIGTENSVQGHELEWESLLHSSLNLQIRATHLKGSNQQTLPQNHFLKMVKVANIAIAILAAAITGTEATFKTKCREPYDMCGWTLTNEVTGYDQLTLQNAASAGGQDPNNGALVYNSLYGCRENGTIIWKWFCDKGCQPAVTFNDYCG